MPSFVTHYYFGNEVQKKFKLNEFVEKFPLSFNMGLQGPDVLFYYFDKNKPENDCIPASKLGSFLHNHAIYEQFARILDFIKKNKDNGRYVAYAYGYLLHYAMDSVAHPYIYYMQEDYLPQFYSENKHKALHNYFESIINNYIYVEKMNKSIKQQNTLTTSKEDRAAIAEFYVDIFNPMLGTNIDKQKMISALKFFKTYQAVFADPTKILPTILKGISALANYPSTIYGFIHPSKLYSDTEDWYNKNHRYWPRLRGEDEVVSWDIDEILDKCMERAEDLLIDFDECFTGNKNLDESLYTVTFDGNRTPLEDMSHILECSKQ